VTPTERARRSDALYYDTESVARRCLCDMIANRESDLEDARAENAKLRELVRDMLRYYAMPNDISYRREADLLERAHEMGVDA
jgi:hypothetical protein